MPVTSKSQSCLYCLSCLSCLFVFVVSIFSVFSIVSLNSLWKSVEGYLIRCAQPTSPHRFLWKWKWSRTPAVSFCFVLKGNRGRWGWPQLQSGTWYNKTLPAAQRTQVLTALIKSIILKITEPLLRTCNLFHLTLQIQWSQILKISRKKSMLVGHLVDLAW